MAKKYNPMKIKVPLFPATVYVFFSAHDYKEATGESMPYCSKAFCRDREYGADIVLGNPNDDSSIAHECVHAAWACLEFVGAKSNITNQEPLAYVVGYLVGEITKGRKKWAEKLLAQEPQTVSKTELEKD